MLQSCQERSSGIHKLGVTWLAGPGLSPQRGAGGLTAWPDLEQGLASVFPLHGELLIFWPMSLLLHVGHRAIGLEGEGLYVWACKELGFISTCHLCGMHMSPPGEISLAHQHTERQHQQTAAWDQCRG